MQYPELKKTDSFRTALSRIKKYRPGTMAAFHRLGVPVGEELGEGAFRRVFRLEKFPDVVVKFPIFETDGCWPNSFVSKIHTTTEVKRIEKMKRYGELRRHAPKIYHHDRLTGVLLMKYYEEVNCWDTPFADTFYAMGKILQKYVKKVSNIDVGDISPSNVGVEVGKNREGLETYNLVFLDLGY